MKNKFQVNNHRIFIFLQIFMPGIFILFVQYVWKYLFHWSGIPGIYWLFVFLDWAYFYSLVGSALIGIFLLVLRGFLRKYRNKNIIPLRYSLSMIFLSFAILLTFPVNMALNTIHLQQIRVEDKVYNLGAYPFFDVNFYVAECDSLGFLCRTIYRSGDVSDPHWEDSHLKYDSNNRELIL